MGLVVQKHVTTAFLFFDKKAMAYLPFWPTYPTFLPSLVFLPSLCIFKKIWEKKSSKKEKFGLEFRFNPICTGGGKFAPLLVVLI